MKKLEPAYVIIGVTFLAVLGIMIYLMVSAVQRKGSYAPYNRTAMPTGASPLVANNKITPYTPDDIKRRDDAIKNAIPTD